MQPPDPTTDTIPPLRPVPPLPGPLPPPLSAVPQRRSRGIQLALFVAALAWYRCSRMLADGAARGLAQRFDLGDEQALLSAVLLLFLLVSGLALLRVFERRRAPLRLVLGLPRRKTSWEEWRTGAALGWGIAIATVLPMMLARSLNGELWTAPRAIELLCLSLATLFVVTLAHTLAIFGYAFQRLIEATGPVRATLLVIALVALHAFFTVTPLGTPDGVRILVAMLSSLLLCLCWLRTHGLWLGWGVHFAWVASTGVLFGLPLGGDLSFASVVDMRAAGPGWLTGGSFGPGAAAISILLVLAAIPLLVRLTGDYAWSYTHPPLIPAGYDVTMAPPAAHVAMEQSALASQPVDRASLVQILPVTPQGSGRPSE